MSLLAPINIAPRGRGDERRARAAAVVFAIVVHALALLAVMLSVARAPVAAPAPYIAVRLEPAPPPVAAASASRSGGSQATAPKHAPPRSPRSAPARLPPVKIRPPTPVPILPLVAPALAAPTAPDLASPAVGASLSAGAGAGGAGVGVGTGMGGAGDKAVEPEWIRKPTSDQVKDAYPSRASRLHLRGLVQLRCLELTSGRVKRCVVLSEAPSNEGFGGAAVKLSRAFLFTPFLLNGQPVEAVLPVTYDFTVEEATAKPHGD